MKCKKCNKNKEIITVDLCITCFHTMIDNKFKAYKRGANSRGYTFKIKKKEFKNMIICPCAYCGNSAFNNHTLNGIDRVNNHIGYTIKNCVPCCKICNRMKHSMNATDFYNQCDKITKCKTSPKGL